MTQILVIEDEINIRENLTEILTLEKFDVIGAENGLDGVEKARQHLPDLIICDIMMPELDGFGVLMELRNHAATANIPFIFLTAVVDRASNRYGMNIGADDYITKPFTPAEVLSAIRTRLEKRRSVEVEYEQKFDRLRRNIVHALPHELRTPLTGILGCADFLMMENEMIDPQQVISVAQIIERSAKRLQHLIENYLLYAQLEILGSDEKGVEDLRADAAITPAATIYDAAHYQARLNDREKDLRLNVVNGSIAISEQNLAKIVYELVDNACKFSPLGTPIDVEARVDSDHYTLTVTDQGRGMTPEAIRSIGAYVQFERKLYEQQGVGLGLTLVRKLAELHGGSLTVQSQTDSGSTFQVTLPIRPV